MKILSSIVALTISGCAITDGASVVVGKPRAPTKAEEVQLYTKPPPKYEEIAIVSATSAHDMMSQQSVLDIAVTRLKEEAAKHGANGIILEGVGEVSRGSSGVVMTPYTYPRAPMMGTVVTRQSSGQQARGMAIFVPQP